MMDIGFRKKVIRPIRAKKLFIPISRRAHRIGPTRGAIRGLVATTTRGGLQYGTDFVLVSSVRTPTARRGSRKGPNFYFTSANEDAISSGRITKVIGASLDRAIRKAGS